jgi:DNA-binding IclR family transcriptional regulator
MATPLASTVLKAFQVLDLFTERQVLVAPEVARSLGVPRASAHRMLVTLAAAGILECEGPGEYTLSMRLFEIGSCVPLRRKLHDEAINPLVRLVSRTQLPAQLGVRQGQDVLFLERVGFRDNDCTPVGRRGPLHATGVGKVLLAFAPQTFQEAYLARPLKAYTPYTVTNSMQLHRELCVVRKRGVSYGRQERKVGFVTIARPIRNLQGRVVAGVSVVVPEGREAHLRQIDGPLAETCREIERQFRAAIPMPDGFGWATA